MISRSSYILLSLVSLCNSFVYTWFFELWCQGCFSTVTSSSACAANGILPVPSQPVHLETDLQRQLKASRFFSSVGNCFWKAVLSFRLCQNAVGNPCDFRASFSLSPPALFFQFYIVKFHLPLAQGEDEWALWHIDMLKDFALSCPLFCLGF